MKFLSKIFTVFILVGFSIGQVYLLYDIKEDLLEIYGAHHESACDNENDCCTNTGDSCCDDGCTCISHPCPTSVALCYLPSTTFFHAFNPKNLNFISFQQMYDFNFLNDIFHSPAFQL